jgi:hypothetical protein
MTFIIGRAGRPPEDGGFRSVEFVPYLEMHALALLAEALRLTHALIENLNVLNT